MLIVSQQQAKSRYKRLPQELRQAIFSFDIAELIEAVANKRNLPDKTIGEIARVSGLVLMGFIPLVKAPAELADSAGIPLDVAAAVFADLLLFYNPLMRLIEEAAKLGETEDISKLSEPAESSLKPLPGEAGPLYIKVSDLAAPAARPVPVPSPIPSAYSTPAPAPALPKSSIPAGSAQVKAPAPFILRQETAVTPVKVDAVMGGLSVQGAGFTSGDQMRNTRLETAGVPRPARLEMGSAPKDAPRKAAGIAGDTLSFASRAVFTPPSPTTTSRRVADVPIPPVPPPGIVLSVSHTGYSPQPFSAAKIPFPTPIPTPKPAAGIVPPPAPQRPLPPAVPLPPKAETAAGLPIPPKPSPSKLSDIPIPQKPPIGTKN